MNISKTAIAITVLSLLLVLLGGFSYYNTKSLNENIKLLNDQNTELVGKINKQDEVIKSIKLNVADNVKVINDLEDKRTKTDIEVGKIINKISKHDFNNIAEKKPKLLENVLRKSIKEENKRLMEITK